MSVPDPATTDWVALWSLTGGVALDYKGSWAAGSYTDGDVVVHQGVTYMCVRPTSAAPVPWPLASGSASYGTSPPANPVDGQIWMLPASDGVVWQFRYNAAGATYKWEFVGGAPVYKAVIADQIPSPLSTYVYLTTQLSFLVPRAGDYLVDARARAGGSAVSSNGIGVVKTSTGGSPGFASNAHNNANWYAALAVEDKLLAVSAGDGLAVVYHATASISFGNRSLSVIPVRVS